jgi:hypothetical protein
VAYNADHPFPSPGLFQTLMLINPFVWVAAWFFLSTGPDLDLMRNGIDYVATVENSHPYTISGKYGPQTYKAISYKYVVNGEEYTDQTDSLNPEHPDTDVGSKFKIHALPSKPTYTEPVFEPAGTRFKYDLGGFSFCFFICLFFELWIWLPALRQRKLVIKGTAVPAEVTHITRHSGADGETYRMRVKFSTTAVRDLTALVPINASDYARFRVGNIVTVLYDPNNPGSSVVYKRSRYRAVPIRTPAP